MPWSTVDSRDTRPEGPAFVCPDCDGEWRYGCHVCGPIIWPDPPERHDDLRDDVPAPSDPVGGGY